MTAQPGSYRALTETVSANLATLRSDSPALMKGFGDMARAATADGALSKKTKELIALALGVAAHCGPDPAQRLVRRGARVLQGHQRRLRRHYKKTTGKDIKIDQSHGGSSAQARAVNDGLDADVVTMNTTTDIDFLAGTGIVAKDWARQFPNNASPTSSTMLFLVRNGNPKGIKDWDDLIKPGVQVIVVNPKTGGNGRMAYLAAWGYVRKKGGTDAQAAEFVASCTRTCRCWPRAGATPPASSCSATLATCWSPSSRRWCRWTRSSAPARSTRSTRRSASWPRTRWPWWSAPWPKRARLNWPRPTWTFSTPTRRRRSPPSTPCARAQRPS
jgi:hypothetical protein